MNAAAARQAPKVESARPPVPLVPLVRASNEKADRTQDHAHGSVGGAAASLSNLPKLTAREKEILRHCDTGACSQAIADALFVSKRTIDFHLANVFRKLGVRNRIQAINLARQNGLLSA